MSGVVLPFSLGTRVLATVTLTDPTSGATLADGDTPVTVDVRWSDDPAVVRARAAFLTAQAQYEMQVLAGDSVSATITPERAGELAEAQARTLDAFAVALVAGWSVEDECTPEAVAALIRRAPFVRELVVSVATDGARFFPTLSPSAPSTPAASFEGAA